MRAEDVIKAAPEPEPVDIEAKFPGVPRIEVEVQESSSPISKDETADAVRRAAAVSLVEPDTYGYLLFKLDANGQVEVQGYVQPEWWPAFIDLCQSTAQVGLETIGRA